MAERKSLQFISFQSMHSRKSIFKAAKMICFKFLQFFSAVSHDTDIPTEALHTVSPTAEEHVVVALLLYKSRVS